MFLKKFFVIVAIGGIIFPLFAFAQTASDIFEAKVIKILEEKQIDRGDGTEKTQQNLLLIGKEGFWEDKEIKYEGISDLDIASSNVYKVGDKVLVQKIIGQEEEESFLIVDYVRSGKLALLAFLFALTIVLVGGKKGWRAILGLVLSFFIILEFIIPRIIAGNNPLFISLIGSFLILVGIIYLSEGVNRKSNLGLLSVFISLSFTLILSWLFVSLTKLTGLASEEAVFLIGTGAHAIDFRGLLLAGMLIGAVGVLDDVVIGQLEAVKQIKEANKQLNFWQVFTMAYKVGNTHLGAIVNTLFLTYAGASLPLLLLFTFGQSEGLTFAQAINNEMVATEIIRTLSGSIGIALSMPIATFLGAKYLK
ncbi:MAG TPA: YibE/F family protein [Candidatus Magasanikbacteria bacterium]|nr:YibE/F family protein [Candidatus Magasanikbacteria bacterium]